MHLAVGQGDLLTSPLQMAVAYSTLADAFTHGGNGWVVRPHLGTEIDGPQGRLVQALSFPAVRHVHLNDTTSTIVMEGIHEAASQPGGTSADVWAGWDQALHPVYGKTGTAEHAGKEDQSWYMCYIADPKRPIVLAVTVEQGGFGAETAAPIARLLAAAVVRPGKEVRRRELAHVLRPLSPITAPEQAAAPPATAARTLRLPLDPLLTIAVAGLGICSIVTLGAATKNLIPSQPRYYVDRQSTYLIVGLRGDARALASGLRTPAAAEKRPLRPAAVHDPGGARARPHRARLAARDQPAVLLLPGVRARQGAAHAGARGARGRPRAATARARDDGARDARRAGSGDVRDRPAGPRLGDGLRRDRIHAAIRRGRLLAASRRR